MDPRRIRLQLRIVQAVLRRARPDERRQMLPRAVEILDKVAVEIEPEQDPALTAFLREIRAEFEMPTN